MTFLKRIKLSRCKKVLIFCILVWISLSFVKAPPPLDPDNTPLPTTYEAYHRKEEQTYITFPEWYLVYMSDEYARFLNSKPPSAFPYFGYIGQFWSGYWKIYQLTREKYPFNTEYHVMIAVIGTSTTVEYSIKGLYEKTIGSFTEWGGGNETPEDKFAAETAADYVKFIRVYPWYEYDFATKFEQLWQNTGFTGEHFIRKYERKFALSLEYGFKTIYGWVIKKLTYLSYGSELPFTVVQAQHLSKEITKQDKAIKFISIAPNGSLLIAIPRYEAFKNYAQTLSEKGAVFEGIAGNTDIILLTVIANRNWNEKLPEANTVFSQDVLIDSNLKRVGITVPVSSLSNVLKEFKTQNVTIEHIYDY